MSESHDKPAFIVPEHGRFEYTTREGDFAATIDLFTLSRENQYVLMRRGCRAVLGNEAASKATAYSKRPIDNGDGTARLPSDEEIAEYLKGERATRLDMILNGSLGTVREAAEPTDPFENRVRAKAEIGVREHLKGLKASVVRQNKEKSAPVGVFMGAGESRKFFTLEDLITIYLENDGDTSIRDSIETTVKNEIKAEERARAKLTEQAKGSAFGKMFG